MKTADYIAIQVLEPSDNVGLEEKCDLSWYLRQSKKAQQSQTLTKCP